MRAVTLIILLALALAAPACDEGSPWGGGNPPPAEEGGPDFGPTAAYNRRIVFLGPAGNGEAAVFDFIALSDSIGIRRGVRARVARGAAWRPLMDAGWEMAPMREPWRLVPHGPLTLVVGAGGDLGTLVVRDSASTTRLELGQTLAEHSPDVGTQLVLRNGTLTLDGQAVSGLVLDAKLGRAVSPALAVRDNAPLTSDTAGADTVAPSPTPIALPGAEALLLGPDGYYAVLATASGGNLAWIRVRDQSDIHTGARLDPIAWSNAQDTAVQVPTAWRVVAVDGGLDGELTARAIDRSVLFGTGDLEALEYAVVTGWIEDQDGRHDVYGLVRHVR